MAERVQVREIDDDEGRRLLRIIRRGTGSVVTWRRAQMVLLSAQSMPVAKIAEVTFTSPDRVRDVLHNFSLQSIEIKRLIGIRIVVITQFVESTASGVAFGGPPVNTC